MFWTDDPPVQLTEYYQNRQDHSDRTNHCTHDTEIPRRFIVCNERKPERYKTMPIIRLFL